MYLAIGSWFWFLLVILLVAVVWFWTWRSDKGKKVKEPELVTDPVCEMRFAADKAVAKVRHNGKTYYFCAEACRRDFEADPSRYLGTAHGSSVTS